MPSETFQNADPVAADFAGADPLSTAKRLFNATRPKFFPASALPVLAGSAWGVHAAGAFDGLSFALALGATMCVHAAANVLNDVGDDQIGTDGRNDERIYPYTGGSRFIQAGIMSRDGMLRFGIGLLIAAVAAGAWLLLREGAGILWFGLVGMLLTIAYSLGPVRLSTIGLGELAVGAGLGVLPVVGAAWLQSGRLDLEVLLFSVPVALWVSGILLINEVPDIKADGATGKRTLPVRLGLGGTAILYLTMNVAAVLAVGWLAFQGAVPAATPLLPAALLVLAMKAGSAIRQGVADRAGMTRAIESTLATHTLGSLWLTAVMLYAAFTA